MCQVAPGPRCWSDSKATAASLQRRLNQAETNLSAKRAAAKKAESAGDFTLYSKLRKEQEKLVVKVNELRTLVRHNQRDMDGTKTGRRLLEEEIAQCADPVQLKTLQDRIVQSEALRFTRSHALETISAERTPLLRIAA